MLVIVKFIITRSYLCLLVAGLLGGLSQLMLPLALLSSALLSVSVLRKGEKEGLGFLLLVAVIIYLLSHVIEARPGLEFPVALMLLAPVFMCSSVLRITELHGLVVTAAGLFAALMVLAIQMFSGDAVVWWKEWLELAVQGINGATVNGFEDNGTLQIMNGLVATFLAVASILSVFIGRWMQSLVFNPGGFQSEFHRLLMPRKVLYAVLLSCAIFYVLQKNIMLDLAIIATMMYAFQGLAIFHYNTHKKGYNNTYLFPPYLMLLFVPQFAVLGLACVGVSDVFLNYRKL